MNRVGTLTPEGRARLVASGRARVGWHHTPESKAKMRASNRAVQRGQTEPVSTPAQQAKAFRQRLERFGLTPESYSAMLEAQQGGCAICGQPNGWRHFAIDHDHVTGRVRGLLCHGCNLALGHLERLEASGLLDKIEEYRK